MLRLREGLHEKKGKMKQGKELEEAMEERELAQSGDPVKERRMAAQVIVTSLLLKSYSHRPARTLFSVSHRHVLSIFWKRGRNILALLKNQWPRKLQCSEIEVTFNYHLQSHLTYVVNYTK